MVKKTWITHLSVGIATLFVTFAILFGYTIDDTQLSVPSQNPTPFGGISTANSLIQTVEIQESMPVDQIAISLATYARTNKNTTSFVVDVNDVEVHSELVPSGELKDNSDYALTNLGLSLQPGDKLTIKISSDDADEANAITAWIGTTTEAGSQLYRLNGTAMEPVAGTLIYKLQSTSTIWEDLFTEYQDAPMIAQLAVFAVFIGAFCTLEIFGMLISDLMKYRKKEETK